MTDFSFDDDPFKDDGGSDPFASGADPFASGDLPLDGDDGLSMGEDDLAGSPFLDPNADLPADLVAPPPPNPLRNRSFVIGLVVLAGILVLGLGLILVAAIGSVGNNSAYHATETAIATHNIGILTQVAGTSTAKSYSPTPSNTWTPSVTPTYTPSSTPTETLTPTLTPSNTPVPGVTASITLTPSPTATITNTPVPITPPDTNALNTQAAALQSAQQVISALETQNAHSVGDKPATQQYKKTQAAEFNSAQTAIAAQLTINAQAASSSSPTLPAPAVSDTASSPTPTPPAPAVSDTGSGTTLTPSPTIVAQAGSAVGITSTTDTTGIVTISPGTVTATPAGSSRLIVPNGVAPVSYIHAAVYPIAQQAQSTPVLNAPTMTALAQQLISAAGSTATAQFITDGNQQIIGVQTALVIQLTLNALVTPQTTAIQTENAQLQLGLTAVSIQLTANAQALSAPVATPAMPGTGIYEDLAGGKVNPASLMLILALAVGLVAVIVAARRLRTR